MEETTLFSFAIPSSTALARLRVQWALTAGFSTLFLTGFYKLLAATWQLDFAARWLVVACLGVIYLLWVLGRNLSLNHRTGEVEILPTLGYGNALTLARGILLAALAGFLFLPRPEGGLAWAPGILYTAAALADYFDGYLARITRRATKLGEILDMSFDGLGVLVATLLAVLYGQAPAWYVIVGLARPLFIAGSALRTRLGLPNQSLPPNIARRGMAGLQMGLTFVLLWPVFSPPGTEWVAAFFAVPFLVGFLVDWLITIGWASPDFWVRLFPQGTALHHLPVALRAVAVFLLLALLAGSAPLALKIADALVLFLLALGVSGRIAAIAGLVLLGIHQGLMPLLGWQIGLSAVLTAILYLGTGAYSLWMPETRLISHRAGEAET